MPAKLIGVTLWDDLQAAGGSPLGACWPWTTLTTSYRSDGDDRVTGTIARNATGADGITQGAVLRYERADGTLEEWVVQVARDTLGSDIVTAEALGARVWLGERVVVRSGTDLSLSGSGSLSAVLAVLMGTDEWPAWVTAGTISRDVTIAYDWNQSSGLAALLGMVDAANATEEVALANETVRLVFRRVDDTEYALDFLTTAASGTPILAESKNLSAFTARSDRIQRPSAIYPINATGGTIAEAMFAVRTASSNVMDMRDWVYRDDFLGVAFDGQWVGWYAVAPDGSTSVITDSSATAQTITVADDSAWGAGNNATVRLSETSGGTPTLYVADTTVTNRRAAFLTGGTWLAKINWLPNSRFDAWTSATVIKDWTTTGGMTTNRVTDIETGTYAVEIVTGGSTGAATVMEVLMPEEVVTNNGGTQTWRVGFRYKRTVNTGASVTFDRSVNGGSSWTTMTALGSSATFDTYETTFTTTSAILPNRPRLRFASTATAGSKYVIDRVWLFRDGVDDGDDTFIGNGPSVGFYTGQRELVARRIAGAAYEVGIIDRHRDDPTTYPNDNLAVHQNVRLVVPSRSVDASVTLAGLDVNELAPTKTTAQVGSLRRRLTGNL